MVAERERRWRRIARLWGDGRTQREIGARLGLSDARVGAEIAKMRAAGWELERRSVARVEVERRRTQVKRMWQGGATLALIAERTGMQRSAVASMVRRMQQTGQLRRRRELPVRLSPRGDRIRRMWERGATIAEIATALDMSPKAVAGRISELRRQGLPVTRRARTNHTRTRRARIARLYSEGMPLDEIAAELGGTARSIGATVSQLRAQGVDLPRRM